MEYTSCRFLESGIHFFFKQIRLCNSLNYGPVLIDNYNGNFLEWSYIKKKREQILESCRKGLLPECCKECPCLETKEWESNPKFKFMEIFHWLHCNCSCIYCSNSPDTHGRMSKEIKKSDYYDILPMVKDIVENDMLDHDAEIFFGGGEPAVLEELPDLLELLIKNGVRQINLPTSGVLYSDAIVKSMDLVNHTTVTISIDSGTPGTYLEIKKINAFDVVLDNIKRYLQSTNALKSIILKYIILDKINDNIPEIEKWLMVALNIGLRYVCVALEYSHSTRKKKGQEVPKHFYNLFEYARTRSKELGLIMVEYDSVNHILDRGYY